MRVALVPISDQIWEEEQVSSMWRTTVRKVPVKAGVDAL